MFKTPAQIRADQLAQLKLLLAALKTNAFYQQKGTREAASLDEFSRFPFTTKAELVQDQLDHPIYGTNLTYPLERYTRFHQTSGTKGTPLRWLDTPESWTWMVNNWVEVFKAAEVTSRDRILFAFSFGPFIGFWLAYEAAQKIGALCIPTGGTSSVGRLKLLLENRATVLCCTPTYAAHLAEVAGREAMDLSKSAVRLVMVAGEIGGSVPATRDHLKKLWHGAEVFDHHGMTEVGPVTFQCPKRPCSLHVNESAYIAEIINDTGENVRPGERGELVLTTLGRIGSPLLRYKTGDSVKAVPQEICNCGRADLLLDGGILGRVDDMVIVRGVNVYPSALEAIVREFPEIIEYQVQVDRRGTMPELLLKIEVKQGNAATLGERLHEALQLRIPIEIVPALPRFELKAKRWVELK